MWTPPSFQREYPLVQLLATHAERLLQLWFGPATNPSSDIEILNRSFDMLFTC
jgi:hypothetical protein